jgi:hypothetical protein
MTWPAPTLPIDFTNATAQQDLHPQAHNVTNQTLNDNYRPELTRVGEELAGTQSVYAGTDPAGNSIIEADTIRLRTRYLSRYVIGTSTVLGRVPYDPGTSFFQAEQRTDSLATTGSTPLAFVGVQVPTRNGQGWPNGGVLEINGVAFFQHGPAPGASTACLACGIALPPSPRPANFDPTLANEPSSWPSVTTQSRMQLGAPVSVGGIDVGASEAGLSNRYMFEIPAGTPEGVWGWIGVAHRSGGSLTVASGSLQVRSWAE